MILINFGVMRGGIHVYLGWIIKKFPDESVILYNNIQNFNNDHLVERKIKKNDDRINPVKSKITEDETKASLRVYSFEGRLVRTISKNDIKKLNPTGDEKVFITIQLRNPYNNYASILSYVDNNGSSYTVKQLSDSQYFSKIWLNHTKSIKKNQIVVFYDSFINKKEYREKLSTRLGINPYIDILPKLTFGGGSSFKTKTKKKKNQISDYNNRFIEYENDERMIKVKENEKIQTFFNKHLEEFNLCKE